MDTVSTCNEPGRWPDSGSVSTGVVLLLQRPGEQEKDRLKEAEELECVQGRDG